MTSTSDSTPFRNRDVLAMARTDPQLNELIPDPAVTAAISESSLSYAQVIATALNGYAKRPAMGQRAYEVVFDPSTDRRQRKYLPRFETITYDELHNRVK